MKQGFSMLEYSCRIAGARGWAPPLHDAQQMQWYADGAWDALPRCLEADRFRLRLRWIARRGLGAWF